MKQITLFLSLLISVYAYSQADCSNSQTINLQVNGTETVNSSGVSGTAPTSTCNPNFYDASDVTSGDWYTFTPSQNLFVTVFAAVPGSINNDYVPSVSVYEGSCGNLTCVGGDLITADADGNAFPVEVQFGASANTSYYIVFDDRYSNIPAPDGPIGTTAAFSFDVTTQVISGPPSAVTNPDPADGSTVFLTEGTDMNGDPVNEYTFDWTLPAGSEPASSYFFEIGTDNTVSAFSISVTGSQITLTGLALDTTYFWRITSENVAGNAPGPVWSFTTEDTLSAEDFEEAVSFEFFINNGLLNIKANQSFNQINIFDLSGKKVMSQQLSSNDENVAIQSLANGLYLAKVQMGDQTKTFKFLK